MPLALAVSTREYRLALATAPLTVSLKSQPPPADGHYAVILPISGRKL